MELVDNTNRLLGDDLKQALKPGARLKVAASCFSKHAFEALKAELEQINETFVKELATHEPLRTVLRDAGFKDSAAKINVAQIFKLLSPGTEVKCL